MSKQVLPSADYEVTGSQVLQALRPVREIERALTDAAPNRRRYAVFVGRPDEGGIGLLSDVFRNAR